MKPGITVLMPVFNAERYLAEAIQSILDQTYRTFEFLIIDDGSTDRSIDIIRAFKDSRIRLIENRENSGITSALNRGIALSRYELIARMDADDIAFPQRLEKQVDYMVKNPACAMVSSWVETISGDGKVIGRNNTCNNYLYYNLVFECCIYHPTVLYRKTAVESVGNYSMVYSEDYELWWKLSRKYRIHNLDEVLLYYRISPFSTNLVLRKQEYEKAHRENVLKHIRYYLEDNTWIKEGHFQCLRYNFSQILKENSIESIINCFILLDRITERIIEKENINKDIAMVQEAYFHKKRYMLEYFGRNLPRLKALQLLVRMRSFGLVFFLAYTKIKREVTNIFTTQQILKA